MRKDINITEVAKQAGVSIATVSRVINSPDKVKESTRRKIESIIEETGYRPNILARELAEKSTKLIGIITHSITGEGIPNSIYGISRELESQDFNIMIACTNGDLESERKNFYMFQSKRVEGVLFFTRHFKEEHQEMINRLPFPVVVLLQNTEKAGVPFVSFDNYHFANEATKKIINLGHEQIAFISGPTDSNNSREREAGFIEAMQAKSLNHHRIFHGDYSIGSGYQITKAMINEATNMTAIIAVNDGMAIGAINCLKDHGYQVPADISVLGLDETTLADASRPKLSGVYYSYQALGTEGAKLLMKQIKHHTFEFEKHIIPYEIRLRDSVTKPK